MHTSGDDTFSEFSYRAAWLKHRSFFPVSPELRGTRSGQWRKPPRTGDRNIFAALADTEPSGFALSVIQRAGERGLLDAFRQPGADPGPSDLLCTVLDTCRLGALRVHPSGAPSTDAEAEKLLLPRRSDLEAIGVAVAAFERGQEDLRQLLSLLYCATALGGFRPKCTYIQDDGQLGVAKFPSVFDASSVNRVEVLTMHLAKAAGIKVVDVSLMHPVSTPFVVAPRFDRSPNGERKALLSARSLLLAEDDDLVDHFDLLDAMRIHCKDFKADAGQLWRRLVFCLLVDDAGTTLRKIGFLYAGTSRWSLAPAHGLRSCICPSVLQPSQQESHWAHRAPLEALMKGSKAFEIKPSDALVYLRHQVEVLGGWKKLASQFAVHMSTRDIEMTEPVMNNPQLERVKQLMSS